MKNLICLFMLLGFSLNSQGALRTERFSSNISEIVKNELKTGQDFIRTLSQNTEEDEYWPLSRIRLLAYPLIKFDLWFLEFKVAPVVELRWTRPIKN